MEDVDEEHRATDFHFLGRAFVSRLLGIGKRRQDLADATNCFRMARAFMSISHQFYAENCAWLVNAFFCDQARSSDEPTVADDDVDEAIRTCREGLIACKEEPDSKLRPMFTQGSQNFSVPDSRNSKTSRI